MSSWFKTAKRNYASIVAPLSKMKQDLLDYINEQTTRKQDLENQKAEIDVQISESNMEIAKSEGTAQKIAALLMLDLDEDGISDVDELPPAPTDSTDAQDITQ